MPPKAPPPEYVINTEASSQRDSVQGGVEKIVKAAPGDQTSGARDMGEKIPTGVDGGDHLEFDPQSDTVSETRTAPESSRRPSPARECVPVPPATSVQPEAPGASLAALKSASIIGEHRALMGAASVAATAAHTAEVSRLNQSLERAEPELGQLKRQLADQQGVMTEVEALKKAVAEAKEKAAIEQALREKHEAKVVEAERELQEAMEKCETLEQSLTEKESELSRAHQAVCDAQGALQEIQEAREIMASKAFFQVKQVFEEKIMLYNFKFRFLQGYLQNFLAAYRMPPNSTEPKRGILWISSSGRSIWHRIIRCLLSIN
ncbi:uncharacterized protein LOC125535281 [Triticum urartu]|uniref:uncharacterized protein LOC125535281 n=1 Tax=Triticum urartu TaxID=4572 RepID=UPI002042E296|nr:uncharacterized protein LOC125535281 [Triticum urartu]